MRGSRKPQSSLLPTHQRLGSMERFPRDAADGMPCLLDRCGLYIGSTKQAIFYLLSLLAMEGIFGGSPVN